MLENRKNFKLELLNNFQLELMENNNLNINMYHQNITCATCNVTEHNHRKISIF